MFLKMDDLYRRKWIMFSFQVKECIDIVVVRGMIFFIWRWRLRNPSEIFREGQRMLLFNQGEKFAPPPTRLFIALTVHRMLPLIYD